MVSLTVKKYVIKPNLDYDKFFALENVSNWHFLLATTLKISLTVNLIFIDKLTSIKCNQKRFFGLFYGDTSAKSASYKNPLTKFLTK